MKVWVGITDLDWFEYLSRRQPDEVNFWQPSSGRRFRVLQPGEPFLFKLHSPQNFIVGGGFFVRHTALPCSLAWSAFGSKNGVESLDEFLARIAKYRRSETGKRDPTIGCSILAEPFFFPKHDWIPVPSDWAMNIVQGKTYDTTQESGAALWAEVQARLSMLKSPSEVSQEQPQYGTDYLTRARLGQGAFRVLVTEAYEKRCAISGERTLPVLQASHIKPFASEGPNRVCNGLLLRSDLHILFDRGYLTLTPNLQVEVSKRIKEEFENGREYYAYQGKQLAIMPQPLVDRPATEFLRWHNDHVFERNGSNF
jgi:putative restriction endonuclease